VVVQTPAQQQTAASQQTAVTQSPAQQQTTNSQQTAATQAPAQQQTPASSALLLRYYRVREGDCYWRIAANPLVYNDRYQWPRLYEANKSKMVNPDNPHLIFPGMMVEIPSLNGELREGTY
jgi:nucleoid-associated protein YgaU